METVFVCYTVHFSKAHIIISNKHISIYIIITILASILPPPKQICSSSDINFNLEDFYFQVIIIKSKKCSSEITRVIPDFKIIRPKWAIGRTDLNLLSNKVSLRTANKFKVNSREPQLDYFND